MWLCRSLSLCVVVVNLFFAPNGKDAAFFLIGIFVDEDKRRKKELFFVRWLPENKEKVLLPFRLNALDTTMCR